MLHKLFGLLTAPGIILHEISHWAIAASFYLDVKEVNLFDFETLSGHVIYELPRAYWKRVTIAFAPFFVNTTFAIYLLAIHLPGRQVFNYLSIYFGVVFLLRALPSGTDADTLIPNSTLGYLHPLFLITSPLILITKLVSILPPITIRSVYTAAIIAGLHYHIIPDPLGGLL